MGRLTGYGDVRRRLFETLHFVKEVVLGSASDIKLECMRIRLLHAAVRHHLQHRDVGWEVKEVSVAKIRIGPWCLGRRVGRGRGWHSFEF